MVKIAFRLNANFQTGSGHLQRCLTLASGMKDTDPSCEILFLTSRSEDYSEKISSAGHKHIDLGPIDLPYEDTEATLNAIKEHSLDILVVDNYSIDEEFLSTIKKSVSLLVAIDDYNHLKKYPVHILVNNNLYAHTIDYCTDEDTQFLLGTEFVLLRAEFDDYHDVTRSNPEKALRILVTFGGSDNEGVSVSTTKALKLIDESFIATIITGRSFKDGECLASEIGIDPRFIVIPDASDMARRMSWADMAIASPSTTFYELMFLRVPSILVQQAENQAPISEYAGRNGLAVSLGESTDFDVQHLSEKIRSFMLNKEERDRICARIDEVVDGLGRFRLAQEILNIYTDRSP